MAEYNTGAYGIFNTVNGKVYVGSAARSFSWRKRDHFEQLRRGKHFNRHLQGAFNKYGEDCFDFRVLERCAPEEVLKAEQRWIDTLDSTNGKKGYNLSPTAGNALGVERSPETRAKLSAMRKGRGHSPEARAKLSAALKGRKRSLATKEKLSVLHKGKKLTLEHREKISAGHRGKKHSSEHVAKRAAARRGMKFSAEARAKMSASHKGLKQSPETVARRLATIKANREKRERESRNPTLW